MKRRNLIKNLTILPAAGAVFGSTFPFNKSAASPLAVSAAPKRDLLKELGVRTFINARGTITAISGSIMHDYVLDAIRNSSK
ncbi:MAG: selenocysteine synthase, partial [Candidatus Pacebacteria bacterium]|nr:selenocysteine synthase [Candidatus Paceibacterota bacterium]